MFAGQEKSVEPMSAQLTAHVHITNQWLQSNRSPVRVCIYKMIGILSTQALTRRTHMQPC